MVNTSELLINAVTIDELKMLISSPKREVTRKYVVCSCFANITSPAKRQDLTHHRSHKWNTVSLYLFLVEEGEP